MGIMNVRRATLDWNFLLLNITNNNTIMIK